MKKRKEINYINVPSRSMGLSVQKVSMPKEKCLGHLCFIENNKNECENSYKSEGGPSNL